MIEDRRLLREPVWRPIQLGRGLVDVVTQGNLKRLKRRVERFGERRVPEVSLKKIEAGIRPTLPLAVDSIIGEHALECDKEVWRS